MDRIDLKQEAYLFNQFLTTIEARCARSNPPFAITDQFKFYLNIQLF